MSFTTKLPAGHEVLSKRSSDLQNVLIQDERVLGTIPTSLSDRKEWVSALCWVDSNKPVLLADLPGLADKEIATLGSPASLIEVLALRVNVLAAWDYTRQQQAWLKERLDVVVGLRKQVVWASGGGGGAGGAADRAARAPHLPARRAVQC